MSQGIVRKPSSETGPTPTGRRAGGTTGRTDPAPEPAFAPSAPSVQHPGELLVSATAPLVALLAIFLIVFATIAFAVDRLTSTPTRVAAVVGIGTLVGSMAPVTRLLAESPVPPAAVHGTAGALRTDVTAGRCDRHAHQR